MTQTEVDIALALLSIPACREAAGYPAYGPLTQEQIARYTGMSPSQVRRLEREAMSAIYLYLHQHPEEEQELIEILQNL